MAPKSTAGRFAAVTYMVACLAVLAFAIWGRDIPDTDVVVAYAMLLLSFPSGYVVAAAFGAIASILHSAFGIVVPGGIANTAPLIIAFAAAGYAQWFILVPWVYRKLRVPSNNALERTEGHGR